MYEFDHKEEDRLVLVVAAGGGGDLLVDILAHLVGHVTTRLNRNIEHYLGLNQNQINLSLTRQNNPNLTGHFVTLVVGLVHALGVGHLPDDGLTLVVRHGHADRDIDVLGRLDRDLLADLLGQHLAAGLVAVGPRVVRTRGSATKPTLKVL